MTIIWDYSKVGNKEVPSHLIPYTKENYRLMISNDIYTGIYTFDENGNTVAKIRNKKYRENIKSWYEDNLIKYIKVTDKYITIK